MFATCKYLKLAIVSYKQTLQQKSARTRIVVVPQAERDGRYLKTLGPGFDGYRSNSPVRLFQNTFPRR
jgi:hypothetical protein